MIYTIFRKTLSLVVFLAVATAQASSGLRCADLLSLRSEILKLIKERRQLEYQTTAETMTRLAAFAKANNLPMRIMETGPSERPVRRLFVAIDASNNALMKRYLDTFNIDTATGPTAAGTLALEFAYEGPKTSGEPYITGVLRTAADPEVLIWRWGKQINRDQENFTQTYHQWWKNWIRAMGHNKSRNPENHPVWSYGHLIGLEQREVRNVMQEYLPKPDERGPCKSSNCVAWTSNIELGKTSSESTPEERRHLFTELGMARASAHFEILRRLVHAANERHGAIAVFVEGQKGYEWFKSTGDLLPKAPQGSYRSIIEGLAFKDSDPQMKAMEVIPDGGKVFIPIAAGASPEGVQALIQHAARLGNGIDVHMLVNGVSAKTLQQSYEKSNGKFRIHALFLGGNLRKVYREGNASVIPGYLADFPRWVRDPDRTDFHYDAMVVRVAPKDEQGRYSLGPNRDMILSILKARPGIKVIAEINENIPKVEGDHYLTEEQITAKFESQTKLAGPAVVPLSETEKNIGTNLARLIPNDATLQVGIGNIFGGLPEGMQSFGRSGIKISTEMFSDPLMNLVKNDIAVSAETGFAYGSEGLYRWLSRGKVKLVDTEYVNDPGRVANTPKFHAVNTALQVNLRGDANATHGPNGRISSPGGQVEFMSGAARSAGGKAIIAIRSTALQGQLSTITLDLYSQNVTTPHESVTHVVTEYGIAVLQGQSERNRAINLISIAHPKFRTELISEAIKRRIIREEDRAKIPTA